MKITLVTLFDKNIEKYARITAENKRRYCAKHGYGFVCFDHTLDATLHPSWSKLQALASSFQDNDWLFWSDADALIVNFDQRLEDFIDNRYHLIVSTDWHGLNFGNFLIQNHPWSKSLLEQTRSGRQKIDFFWEQSSIIRLVAANVQLRARVKLTGSAFNSNYYMPRWDFLLHLCGLNDALRWMILNELGPVPCGDMGFDRIAHIADKYRTSLSDDMIDYCNYVPYEFWDISAILNKSVKRPAPPGQWMPSDKEWQSQHRGAAEMGGLA